MRKYFLPLISLLLLSCSRETPTVEFSVASQTVQEAQGVASVTVNLSSEASLAVRVPYSLSGTATGGGTPADDYLGTDGVITVPIGEKSAALNFPLVLHGAPLADRSLIVTLGTPENGDLGTIDSQTVTISNSGAPPTTVNASFQTNGFPGGCPGVAVYPIQLDLDVPAPSQLDFTYTATSTSPGTLFQDTHYSVTILTGPPGIALPTDTSTNFLTVLTGQTSVTLELAVDCGMVPGEDITISFAALPGTTVGPNSSVTVSF